MGALVMVFGILLRARAAGHVQKDKVLTMTGPYAYTRNPLYLGSILLAIGFGVAAQNVWIGVVMVTLFLAIYIPIIRAEEEYLRATFAGYGEYMKAVPRLLPRLTPAKLQLESGGFSMQRYLKLREYNSIIGALVLLAVLSAKILWSMRAAH